MLSLEEMRAIYDHTEIVRRPTYGIVSGYHTLPYICLGVTGEMEDETLKVQGTVHVSPRFVIRPEHLGDEYGEIFGDVDMDEGLTGRLFGFFGFRGRPVECKSEDLTVERLNRRAPDVLDNVMDGLSREEDITTGVILTPSSRYFQVSIERFIASVIEDEFA